MERQALVRRLRRISQRRGVTLVEVLIVVAIMALIAGGVGFVALPAMQEARVKQAGTQARAVVAVTEAYLLLQGGDCPTVDQLITENRLKSENRNDPWGNTFVIECTADQMVYVTSAGPDGNPGSEDDITVPEDTGPGQ